MWKTGSEIPIVDLVTRTRGRTRHRSSIIISRVMSGLTSLTVLARPREIAIGRIFGRETLGEPKPSPPSQTRPSISLLNINEIILLGLRRPQRRLQGTLASRPHHGDFSATPPRRLLRDCIGANATSTGSTVVVRYQTDYPSSQMHARKKQKI